MITLAVDTTSPGGSAAILRGERVIGSVSTWTDETYSSRIFRQVEFLLEELAVGLAQVDLFAVANGPGSFTGLRVGIAAVKAWAEVHRKPAAGVSALEAIAAQSRASSPLLVPVFDARRGEVYFSFYRREGSLAAPELVLDGEYSVMTPADFVRAVHARLGDTPVTLVTPTPEALSAALAQPNGDGKTEKNFAIEVVPNILAPVIGLLAARRARLGHEGAGNALTLEANYVRRTDAELKWKEL